MNLNVIWDKTWDKKKYEEMQINAIQFYFKPKKNDLIITIAISLCWLPIICI